MNLVLIGFMGAGKSTVAKHLSLQLSLPLVEMDELVYQYTRCKTMDEVFAKGGEILLRETEIAIAKDYASKHPYVLSTGGGVVLNQLALEYLKKKGGKLIFLNTSFHEIIKRLEGDSSRPLFQNAQEAKKLYDFRLPLYLHYADHIVTTDSRSAEEVSFTIQNITRSYGL